jgi:hypothetical protein
MCIVHDKDVAEDIVHDGYILIFTSINQLNEADKLKSWMNRIMVNLSLKYLKSKKDTQPVDDIAGAVIKCCGVSFLRFFRHSWIAVVPILIAMFMYPDCWNRTNIVGVVLVYLVISLLLAVYPYIRGKNILLFLGRNTFIIFIFSPIFTVLTKVYQPYLISFDKSGMLFLLISIPFVLIGSFIVARILEFIPQFSCFLRKVKCAE